MEKSEPMDAAVIEEELEELQRYCQEVFGRVERYYKKLIRLPVRAATKRDVKIIYSCCVGLVPEGFTERHSVACRRRY